jgi:hypothetical protein
MGGLKVNNRPRINEDLIKEAFFLEQEIGNGNAKNAAGTYLRCLK